MDNNTAKELAKARKPVVWQGIKYDYIHSIEARYVDEIISVNPFVKKVVARVYLTSFAKKSPILFRWGMNWQGLSVLE